MTFLSTIEASFVFQISCLLHRLCNMHSSKISLDPSPDIIILNSKLDLIHRSGILMQLKKFLNFARQISHVQQNLISFTDSNISQLPNNDWGIQHSVKRFNLRLNFSHDVKKMINSTSHSEFQTLLTVAQGFRPGHQWKLHPDQSQKLKTVWFCDTSWRNLGSYQILNLAVTHISSAEANETTSCYAWFVLDYECVGSGNLRWWPPPTPVRRRLGLNITNCRIFLSNPFNSHSKLHHLQRMQEEKVWVVVLHLVMQSLWHLQLDQLWNRFCRTWRKLLVSRRLR